MRLDAKLIVPASSWLNICFVLPRVLLTLRSMLQVSFNIMNIRTLFSVFGILFVLSASAIAEQNGQLLQAVQIYSQDELLDLIKNNRHLERVKADRCQLTRDIEDRAIKLKIPAYQFLYGDMLAWGVCTHRDPKLGLFYINKSAEQGLVAAIEQMGRYYHIGRFVQKDMEKAYRMTQRAAEQGNLKAQFRLVQMQLDGLGSPYDFEGSYRWLHHAIIADQKQHKKAEMLLADLAKLMSPKVVKRAKRS